MVKVLRDKSRDDLADSISSLGVQASLAQRGRNEEKFQKFWIFKRSLGVIDIADGPIRWINYLKRDRSNNNPQPRWWVVFGIPDERPISGTLKIKMKTIRKKTFPLFGKVTDVTWRGNDQSTGLLSVLSDDEDVDRLSAEFGDLHIQSYSEKSFAGWTVMVGKRIRKLTIEQWDGFIKISDHLLASSRSL